MFRSLEMQYGVKMASDVKMIKYHQHPTKISSRFPEAILVTTIIANLFVKHANFFSSKSVRTSNFLSPFSNYLKI